MKIKFPKIENKADFAEEYPLKKLEKEIWSFADHA